MIPPHELALLEEYCEDVDSMVARRLAGEPLQHLTGVAHFRYLELKVGPGVFIPRPETEVLAGWAIEHAGSIMVDLGTGSGAIAASIRHEVPTAKVYAVEREPAALAWARQNFPDVIEGDLADALPELNGTVDVVVSNPPYVPAGQPVPIDVTHDPDSALYAGPDGLAVIREVERAAARLLRPGGLVGVEHDDSQGESAPAVFDNGRWADITDHRDLTDRPRFVTARLLAR